MFNRNEEVSDGVPAGVEWDQTGVEEDVVTEPEPETSSDGDTAVKYVGPAGSYTDQQSGVKFKKNEPTSVSEDDAERLTSLKGGTIFVRADS